MDPPTAEFWMRSFDHRLDQILTVDLDPTDGDPDQRISSLGGPAYFFSRVQCAQRPEARELRSQPPPTPLC